MVFDADDVKIDVDRSKITIRLHFSFPCERYQESAQNFEVEISFLVMIFLSSFDDVTK
jgi:hypothetical protein